MKWIRLSIAGLSLLAGLSPALAMPPDFVRLSEVAPGVWQDMRYAGDNNFTGRPVAGYDAPACWLKTMAARALAGVEAGAEAQGLRLIVWDCFRPQRATVALLNWTLDAKDQTMKERFYPRIAKHDLVRLGYIARASAHSTGFAVDVGLLRANGDLLDFGGEFDLFDPRSTTASFLVSATARTNRARLAGLMSARGFRNYTGEWWHFALPREHAPAFDAPIEP